MAPEHAALQSKAATARRRPAAQLVRQSAPATPAKGLQERLGNRGTQALLASARAPQLSAKAKLPAKVSKPRDPAELEAEETARKVARASEPATKAPKPAQSEKRGAAQRAEATGASAPSSARGQVGISGDASLPAPVRRYMEPRFGASFGNVRIHTGESAAQRSAQLGARAFTVGEHVFFGRDQYQPQTSSGRELIAHELTHTIQQGAVVQRSVDPSVSQRSEPKVQRLGLSDALDWIAREALLLPGFRLLTIVLGMNPVNQAPVERNAVNLLRALLELIPVVGPLMVQALENHGILPKVAAWMEKQVRALGMVGSAFKQALDKFLDSLGLRDIVRPGSVWDRAKRIFSEPIDRLLDFGKSLAGDVLRFIREAVLLPLAKLAEGTRGYDLLKAVLGQDPITGLAVPRNAETLIGGFMKLIGQEEVWENIKKSGAIPRAWAWFQGALAGLLGFVRQLPTLFLAALTGLEVTDLIVLPRAFAKLVGVFGGFVLDFIKWAGSTVWTLLEIIFEVVSPGALLYLRKTGQALLGILKNPLPFVRNLVRAAKLGFENFAGNFGTHLKTGLLSWLTGALTGVYIPASFTLGEIVKFVFSVLGISWQSIRAKLVKVVGETAVKVMETSFDLVVTLVTKGPAAAWERIKEELSNLKDMAIDAITGLVVDTVVKKAVPKLISLFIPGAGFITAIVSIYDTVMVFVEKLAKMVEVVKGFVDSIVAIAGGAIDSAAKRVESTLAGALSLAINFLAGFLGLGNIAAKINGVIEKLRARVDKAIDSLIAWIVKTAKALFGKVKAGVGKLIDWWKTKTSFKAGAESHTLSFRGSGEVASLVLASGTPEPIEAFLDKQTDEAKGDAAKTKAIKAVREKLKEINKTVSAASKKKEGEDLQKAIETLMNEMGPYLVTLLTDDEWGTETNPAPFDYPKRRAEAYPTFYLATGKLRKLSQTKMKERFLSQPENATGDRVYRYQPTVQAKSPDDKKTLGLDPSSRLAVGSTVHFEDTGKRGGGVGRFKDLVDKFGFVASESDWDVDHVVELQVGGVDDFQNLWPLPKGENRASGSILKNETIEHPTKKTKKKLHEALAEAKPKKKKKTAGFWLLIKSTKQS